MQAAAFSGGKKRCRKREEKRRASEPQMTTRSHKQGDHPSSSQKGGHQKGKKDALKYLNIST